MKKRVKTTLNVRSYFSRLCQSGAAVILVALALGSLASCSTTLPSGDTLGSVSIHDAARDGDLEKVKALLGANPYLVFSKDTGGQTPLHMAAAYGRKDVVEFLLANKAEVDARNLLGWTPLSMAAMYDHKDVVEVLLANKADINAWDVAHWTPLHGAAARGNKDVVGCLLANRARVNPKERNTGLTPLDLAAKMGHPDVVDCCASTAARNKAVSKQRKRRCASPG